MNRIAFKMKLLPGNIQEYKRRHDALWPELESLLKASGISDYIIFLDESTLDLIAVQTRNESFDESALVNNPIMQRWWDYMSDIMEVEPDNSPKSAPLKKMFYLP